MSSSTATKYARVIRSRNPIRHWRLGESSPETVTGPDVASYVASPTTGVEGCLLDETNFGNAVSLNGSTQYVNTGDACEEVFQAVSRAGIHVRVRFQTTSTAAGCLFGVNGASNTTIFRFWVNHNGSFGDTNSCFFQIKTSSGNQRIYVIATGGRHRGTDWKQLDLVYDAAADTLVCVLNGREETFTTTASGGLGDTTGQGLSMYIGGENSNGSLSTAFTGSIQELIFNWQKPTPQEIIEEYRLSKGDDGSGVIGRVPARRFIDLCRTRRVDIAMLVDSNGNRNVGGSDIYGRDMGHLHGFVRGFMANGIRCYAPRLTSGSPGNLAWNSVSLHGLSSGMGYALTDTPGSGASGASLPAGYDMPLEATAGENPWNAAYIADASAIATNNGDGLRIEHRALNNIPINVDKRLVVHVRAWVGAGASFYICVRTESADIIAVSDQIVEAVAGKYDYTLEVPAGVRADDRILIQPLYYDVDGMTGDVGILWVKIEEADCSTGVCVSPLLQKGSQSTYDLANTYINTNTDAENEEVIRVFCLGQGSNPAQWCMCFHFIMSGNDQSEASNAIDRDGNSTSWVSSSVLGVVSNAYALMYNIRARCLALGMSASNIYFMLGCSAPQTTEQFVRSVAMEAAKRIIQTYTDFNVFAVYPAYPASALAFIGDDGIAATAISGITISATPVITVPSGHGFSAGDAVWFSGTNSTPALSGPYVLAAATATTVTLLAGQVITTGAGTTGVMARHDNAGSNGFYWQTANNPSTEEFAHQSRKGYEEHGRIIVRQMMNAAPVGENSEDFALFTSVRGLRIPMTLAAAGML